MRLRQIKDNTVMKTSTRLEQVRVKKLLDHDKTALKMKVTATRSSLQVNQSITENEKSLIQKSRTAETDPSRMTCKTETRVQTPKGLEQFKVKTPKRPSHVRTKTPIKAETSPS